MIDHIKAALENIQDTNYSFKKPISYVALIPVVSTIVKLIKFDTYEREIRKENNDSSLKASKNFEKVCKAHFQGAIVQTIALTVLFPQVGALLSGVVLLDGLHTAFKALQLANLTKFPIHDSPGYTARQARLFGW